MTTTRRRRRSAQPLSDRPTDPATPRQRLPLGTLTVNLIGCLILDLLTSAAHQLPKEILTLAGTGFCGALTTFSTFGFETTRLLEEGSLIEVGLNALGA